MSDAARIVEDYFARWLRATPEGRRHVAMYGNDGAIDHLFELLNAGHVKLEGDDRRITRIVPCSPPDPPAAPLVRPAREAAR